MYDAFTFVPLQAVMSFCNQSAIYDVVTFVPLFKLPKTLLWCLYICPITNCDGLATSKFSRMTTFVLLQTVMSFSYMLAIYDVFTFAPLSYQ